ncbi:hypothetical protein THAOC_22219 [Thalassiosira oceanica]|uniref:Uncharacterized protein n=1 Tax=Thalassiosira oceanica TaxID=159749 RepID=K0S9W9_THAOC|nr:hypothetical protein THAOC_22219 [Thalassiosira oceanica]|eukprot:EJK57706.1 hypothetical protein THAOC_22219 [Thalassiosira oceanica]
MDEDGAPSQPPSDCGKGDTSASCAVQTASRRPTTWLVVLGVTHRTAGETPPPPPGLALTRSADSSKGRSTVGYSGGSGSIGFASWRRARPGNLGNDGDQGPSPSQRSRLTDRTSMDKDIEINQLLRPGWKSNSSCGRRTKHNCGS